MEPGAEDPIGPRGPARAVTAVRASRLDLSGGPGVRLSSRAFETLERLRVDPLSVRRTGGRLSLLVRALDADPLEAELQRELRQVTVNLERRDGLAAVAALPGCVDSCALLAEMSRQLSRHGISVLDLYLDPGAGGAEGEVCLAVAVVEQGRVDPALRAVHASLVEEARPSAGSRAVPSPEADRSRLRVACG